MASRKLSHGHLLAGKYRLLELLGSGGMGDVYRAEHSFAGRIVAIKLLHADLVEDPELTRRLFLEAQAVNKIRHPNIVDIVDAGPSEEGPYVVMEYLDGVSLAQALDAAKRVDTDTALAVLLPVLDALDAAHRNGIVHRDLKPANIFLARVAGEVSVKILDFGIAKILSTNGAVLPKTSTGIVFGTPDYLSPEQACGDEVIDGRSDLFTIGTLLFELLTGQKPFEASGAVATAYRIVHTPAPPLVSLGILADARLQSVIDTVLEKTPERRFASAAAVAEALAPLAPDGTTRKKALSRLLEGQLAASAAGVPYARTELGASATPRTTGSKPATPSTLVSNDYAPGPRAAAPVMPLRDPRPTPARVPIAGGSSPSVSAVAKAAKISTPVMQSTPFSTGSRPASPWSPRALPLSARGRCHVRGTLSRSVCRWIERAYGRAGRDEVLAMLPAKLADEYRTDGFNALVWYDLEALDSFLEAATQSVLRGDPGVWERLAKDNFDLDLAGIFRPARVTEWEAVLKRFPGTWGRVFDFGAVEVSPVKSGHATVKVDGFDAASLALRHLVTGTVDGMFGGMPKRPKVRMAGAGVSFARELEIDVTG